MKARIFQVLALVATVKASRYSSYNNENRCQPIKIQMCKGLPYNLTTIPNLMGHQDQNEAMAEIHPYSPLTKIKCSADIQLFLCSMYAPPCIGDWDKPLKPCRDLCESARKGCESLMKQFGYEWPKAFECSNFPLAGSEDLCMHPSAGSSGSPIPNESEFEHHKPSSNGHQLPKNYNEAKDFICPAQFSAPKEKSYSLRVNHTIAKDCGAPCYGMFYEKPQISYVLIWNSVFPWLGLLIILFIVATFLIEPCRFPYPQMAIIHMSICFGAVEILYLIGSHSGAELPIACGQPFDTEQLSNLNHERLIRQGWIEYWPCAVIGMALYFFTMAGALWWVMLTVAWFLSTGLGWTPESLESWSSYMHAIVWTLSAIKTVVVIITKKIGGDVLSGVCYVGLWDSGTLLYFVIIPLVLYHVVGIIMLIIGQCYSCRMKEDFRKSGNKTDKFENLITRIGVFSFLYLAPAIIVISCYIFEYIHMDRWMANWQERVCRDDELSKKWQVPCRRPVQFNPYKNPHDQPNITIFILKYVAIHLTAAFTGIWVCVPKTTDSWKRWFYRRVNGQEPAQL